MRALRERHQIKQGCRENRLAVGDVVIVKSEERNRNHWPLAIVTELYTGRDGVVHAAKLRKGKGHIERAIQHLYPLELSCDGEPVPNNNPGLQCHAQDGTLQLLLQWLSVFENWCKRSNNLDIEINIDNKMAPVVVLTSTRLSLDQFYAEMKRKDGEDNEPQSLRIMQSAIEHRLK
ncbi:hypothetical protein QZH41_008034 [Actinostola sp. cb2023]|nr:hypothetical protein QZH41_008034 [Actinostola sp. cb2023]